ncbi:MAG: BNR-4 repeat-containing protein [Bdellovibrionota bacterium]
MTSFFSSAGATRTFTANAAGCLIHLEECPNNPALAGTFYDFIGGQKVSADQCPARPTWYRDTCESKRSVSSEFYVEGSLSGQWSVPGLARHPQFATELAAAGVAPLVHQPIYRHERLTEGYAPHFTASHIGFSAKNHVLALNENGFINKLDSSGSWRLINLKNQVRAGLLQQGVSWDGTFDTSDFSDYRIVFDDSGDAYALFNTSSGTMTNIATGETFDAGVLVYSRDQGETWKPFILPTYKSKHYARLEFRDGNNRISGPPAILLNGGRAYAVSPYTNRMKCEFPPCPLPNPAFTQTRLLVPRKDGQGSLIIGNERLVANNTIFSIPHSGASNLMVSAGSKLFIVYPTFNTVAAADGTPAPCLKGTPQYIVEYDRSENTLGTPVFLGCGGEFDKNIDQSPMPDAHNIPAISIDSLGYLHVVLGAHHDQFVYKRSLLPRDISAWTAGVRIGEMKRDPRHHFAQDPLAPVGSYTYISLVCDQHNMLHLVARWTGMGYRSRLVYLRKSALGAPNAPWDTFTDPYAQTFFPQYTRGVIGPEYRSSHLHLVIPFQDGYTVYHQKLNVDRFGRLFLSYSTWEQQLSPQVAQEYCTRWPDECPNGTLPPDGFQAGCESRICWYQKSTRPKDPALLMSADGGNTWRLATSEDFLSAMVP